jgi:hypothetical protein
MKTILSEYGNMGRLVYLFAKGIIMLAILMIILFQFTDLRELFALWD